MKRRTLKDLDAIIGPERAAKVRTRAERKMQSMLISEVRKRLGLTQAAVAKRLNVTQSAMSQLESQEDMQITTLRRLAKALGAEIDIVLRFPDRSVVVTGPK